ncbi:MAG: hypothetical protein ACI8QZ_004158 [Chlamydiales bacterium]|jgi:hypothetical protein
MVSENELKRFPDSKLECLRCKALMKDAGPMRLHEAPAPLSLGDISGSTLRIVEFDVNICPNCGKTEFFV